ncbi:8-amino-7-oxononanoate synthase [Rhodocyclus tenuis]|uniref:8-amino-7-oxononanoate synthase n=1 Tax=Rhodocyclus tenuis TaxID=1066 RepID=A0A840GK14_RHOTE|nr:8-amino-7-oxononanoate synthase [Rhodocyclus tenuis]MBB4248489.1 8-amino-7-oxononanoate synthase [Rhodocyclus tenuis]
MIADELASQLATLERDGLTRSVRTLASPCGPRAVVDGRELVSFASNDYLGLASDAALIEAAIAGAQEWGVGAGASALVSGHFAPHAELERRLAAFVGRERALLFGTGYLANLGIVPTLVGRGDAVFSDRLNHASLIDAVQLSRADSHRYGHNDIGMLERLLERSSARRKLILTDAVFSMDGDLAPLPELFSLAERYDAWLVVDDAHGFGVLGPQGRGSLAHFGLPPSPRIVHMGTLGKAAGVGGAFVAGDASVIDWLLQRARSHIFTTAAPPLLAVALLKSLELIAAGEARRAQLAALATQLRVGLTDTRWRLLPSPTAIQPVLVGDNHEVLRVAAGLAERGLWVPPIRPPTVPAGSARLRVSLSATHTSEHVAQLLAALRELEHAAK